jgi:hypothetical protein
MKANLPNGHLVHFTTSVSSNTRIVLALKGDNYEVKMEIEYSGLGCEVMENAATRAKDLDDL